ncbi:MAG: formate C-acetyltransferase/glycerol dehydratase family glycyl radical enzyme [Spirochaetia bacterium]|jgi:formate C-acetyltransferase|nr:formate C-acetyltransferase/glycerol dehydratase family glycyl radical enzyme [Spirochaetia bacterium]
MNSRIARLKQEFLDSIRQVDTERAEIVTESYRRHEGLPPLLKRAYVFADLLERTSIEIRPDELIVGNQNKKRRGVPFFPEYAIDWIRDQMDDFMVRKGDRFFITEEQKVELRRIVPYWEGRCLRDQARGRLGEDLKAVHSLGVFGNENYTMSGPGHFSPNYAYLLKKGYAALAAECRKKMSGENRDFYEACAVSCEAVINFASRYADLAENLADEMGGGERGAARRRELLGISRICRRVPAAPAATFQEALQFIYFCQIAIQLEANGLSVVLGRLDQTLIDYYRRDIASGELTEDSAMEILECFFLKLNEVDKIYSNQATRFLQGPGHGQCITIGGCRGDGSDATNELSYMILDADLDVRLVQPDIALRIHRETPEGLLRKAAVNIRAGINKIKIFGDEVIIRSMEGIGVAKEDAWNFNLLGCSEAVIEGKTNSWGNSGQVNLAKCLELALNDGVCMQTGCRMGPATGGVEGFSSFGDVVAAFTAQVRYFVGRLAEYDNILDVAHADIVPLPFYSTVVDGCLERGIEFNRGGAVYNTSSPLGVGPITVGDSLCAIKKLVFEEGKISFPDLVEALRSDFADREPLRQMLINRAPKFGNDVDEVDSICNEVLRIFCDELRLYTNARGGPFIGALYYLSANIPFGIKTAASADGRRAGQPLNDGGISPNHGMDKNGATAVAKSVGKLDNVKVPHGCVLNQRFHPSVFEGEGKIGLFADYMRGFIDLGGWECQYNVITTETLKDAQAHPEKYGDLVVRVAGYSAYFTALEKELQDDIINRTEQILA